MMDYLANASPQWHLDLFTNVIEIALQSWSQFLPSQLS